MTTTAKTSVRPRRFYKVAEAGLREGGHCVLLDGRAPKTPGGKPLVVPTQALAAMLAAEWAAQGEHIHLEQMPATRLANTTLDHVGGVLAETAAEVARYAQSDVTCYFAEHPTSLVERQTQVWGPLHDWALATQGLAFHRISGLTYRPQPEGTLERVREMAAAESDFVLAGLAFAAPLFGSALLALAVRRGRLSGEEALEVSRLDEAFQEERWGVDAEAAARTAGLRLEARMIGDWFTALA